MEKKKSTIFLKLLIVLVIIFMALAYYAYKLIQEDKMKSKEQSSTATVVVLPPAPTPMAHPTLITRDKNRTDSSVTTKRVEQNETKKILLETATTEFVPPVEELFVEESLPVSKGVPKEEIYMDAQPTENEVIEPERTYVEKPVEQEERLPQEESPRVKHAFNRGSIKAFLDGFTMALSRGSVDSLLSYYDAHIEKYFLVNGATLKDVRKDREAYNRRWRDRDFKIENFVILKMYEHEGIEYCKIAFTIKWSVSTQNMGADFGKSRGLMTLKNRHNGFKIVSIESSK